MTLSESPVSAPPASLAGSSSRPVIKKAFHIPTLDGIRAVSFGIVFLSHAAASKWIPGYFGLATFFFLSGYLITTLLRMEFDRTGKINFRDFYLRRVLRIFPPLYLILAVDCVLTLTHVLGNTLWPLAVLAQGFHLTNYWIVAHSHNLDAGWWYGMAPGSWIFWSLAVEEHFYLVFPLLYLMMRRRDLTPEQQIRILLGLCAAVLVWRCLLVYGFHVTKERTYVATDTRVDSILFGCILAVYGNPFLDVVPFSAVRLQNFWVPLGAAALLVSFVLGRFWPGFDQTFRYTVQGLALIPLFIAGIRLPWWGVSRWLNLPAVQFLGLLSYSLYLMHTTVLYGVEYWTHWHRPLVGITSLALCLALATLIYHFVEKPCGRLRKRLSHARRASLSLTSDAPRRVAPSIAVPPAPQEAAAPPFPTARLEFIDGLRGLAMLMVLLFHCWTFGGQWHADIPLGHHTANLFSIFGIGHIGVGLFLVLSGFCLYWPFVKGGARREPTLWEFAKKRCRRILPPYYIALAIFGAVALFETRHSASGATPLTVLKSLGMHLVMLHNMRAGTFFDLNGSFWSLALEFHLYILFPIFVAALARFPARMVLLAVLLFTSGFRFLVIHVGQSTDDAWVNVLTYSVFGRCLEFLLGMIAAKFLARRAAPGSRRFLTLADGALIAGILVLMLAGRHQGLVEVFKAALSGFAFFALLLLASRPGSLLNRWLSSRVMVTLGVFSYSVYLIHQPLALAIGNLTAGWGLSNLENAAFGLLVMVPGLLGLGYLFHLAFERPFLSAHARRETRQELSGAGNNAGLEAPESSLAEAGSGESAPGRSGLVGRNILATLGTQLISWGLTFAVTLYLPRYVGDTGLGKLAFAASFVTIFGVFVPLGTSTVLIKDISRHRERAGELLAAALLLRLPLGLLMSALAVGVAALLHYPALIQLLIIVAAAGMVLGALNDALGAALQGQENLPRLSVAVLTEKFLSSGLTIYLVFARAPLWTLAAVGLFTSLVSIAVNATAFRSLLPTLRWPSIRTIRTLAIAGMPFMGWIVFRTLYSQCDPVVLKIVTNDATVGWYAAASRLVGTCLFLPVAITTALLPTLSRLHRESAAEFRQLSRRMLAMVMLCGIPVALVLLLLPGQIIALLHYPAGFAHSVLVLRIGGLGVLLYYAAMVLGTAVIAADAQHKMMRASLFATVVSIPACFAGAYLGAHFWGNGAVGAMVSDVLTEAYLIFCYLRMLPPRTFDSENLLFLGRCAAAALPMAAFLGLMSQSRIGFWIVIPCATIYAAMCWLLRCISAQDLAMARQILARKA